MANNVGASATVGQPKEGKRRVHGLLKAATLLAGVAGVNTTPMAPIKCRCSQSKASKYDKPNRKGGKMTPVFPISQDSGGLDAFGVKLRNSNLDKSIAPGFPNIVLNQSPGPTSSAPSQTLTQLAALKLDVPVIKTGTQVLVYCWPHAKKKHFSSPPPDPYSQYNVLPGGYRVVKSLEPPATGQSRIEQLTRSAVRRQLSLAASSGSYTTVKVSVTPDDKKQASSLIYILAGGIADPSIRAKPDVAKAFKDNWKKKVKGKPVKLKRFSSKEARLACYRSLHDFGVIYQDSINLLVNTPMRGGGGSVLTILHDGESFRMQKKQSVCCRGPERSPGIFLAREFSNR